MTYLVDNNGWFHEGGYSQLYPIIKHKKLGFKEFSNKTRAEQARKIQVKLAKFDLAPKVMTEVCRLFFKQDGVNYCQTKTDWGFVTELANSTIIESLPDRLAMKKIQKLVDDIRVCTKLKFWDCHFGNIGMVKRNGRYKLVCIDTGKESFSGYCNAWGLADPGPKCSYCLRYECKCEE